ncbi:MAG: hypothetical protein K8L97_31200 [Anaerolineae bacterium]|nr:hypothetical protein [Anaerolineae bacterium]
MFSNTINGDNTAYSEIPDDMPEVDEAFAQTVDFDVIVDSSHWHDPGHYYQTMPTKTRNIIGRVVASDQQLRHELREIYFPELVQDGTLLDWKCADQRYIELLKQKRLFTGKVVAADGTLAKYESLSLVGAQIAVSKVGYRGSTGQIVSDLVYWGKELPNNPDVRDIVRAIKSRGKSLPQKLPNLFLYALMTYKERQVLLDSPPEYFKLIQGPIFPHEMLSGSGKANTMQTCLELIARMIETGNYACIISNSTAYRDLKMLGLALNPGEYIVVRTGDELLEDFLDNANYTNTPIPQYGNRSQIRVFKDFQQKYGSKVVQGVLRAHPLSPPYIFYCNADQLHEAVHILLADASNTGARGFPLLIDLADQYCSGAFKASEYTNFMNAEFSYAAGGSGVYQSERTTRD